MECHSNPHRATVLQDDGYEADREEATNATNANPTLAILIAARASQLLVCLAAPAGAGAGAGAAAAATTAATAAASRVRCTTPPYLAVNEGR